VRACAAIAAEAAADAAAHRLRDTGMVPREVHRRLDQDAVQLLQIAIARQQSDATTTANNVDLNRFSTPSTPSAVVDASTPTPPVTTFDRADAAATVARLNFDEEIAARAPPATSAASAAASAAAVAVPATEADDGGDPQRLLTAMLTAQRHVTDVCHLQRHSIETAGREQVNRTSLPALLLSVWSASCVYPCVIHTSINR